MHMWMWKQPPSPDDATVPARVWGAIPLPAELWEPFKERFHLDGIFQCYGQTELNPIAHNDIRKPSKAGSCGWAPQTLEVAVADDDDRLLGSNEVGEFVVRTRGPELMFQGYFRRPEATVEAFRNLWYHTGDLGRIDEDGELFFVDRKQDYLRRRGENISSMEVEGAAARFPGVALAVVYAVPSEESEDEVMLCVVPTEDAQLDLAALYGHCVENMPYFCVPRFIDVVDSVEVTPSGKVRKNVLRERGVTESTWDAVAAGVAVKWTRRSAS
jgi:crotonobetaine/carnitine-CoA ligase